jgi:predicted signal transduction protein with EAL and GGDEF domain
LTASLAIFRGIGNRSGNNPKKEAMPVNPESPERPASRILAATAYAIAAAVAVAVPAAYFVLTREPTGAGFWPSNASVLVATLAACATGLLAVHALPLRRLRRIEDELRFRAEHDILTRLPNRETLRKRVAEACARADRSGSGVAVMFVDLDDFKMVNDTMGHAAGDTVLRDVATRLREAVRLGDTVARLGGDQFALLF